MALYGIIGVGNMGSAILKASVTAFGKNEVIYYDSSKDKCMEIKEELGISAEPDALSVAGKCKYLILAVKPQQMAYLLEEITPSVNQNHIIVSIAAGIGIQSIKSILGSSVRVVRAMPNTPALLLKVLPEYVFLRMNITMKKWSNWIPSLGHLESTIFFQKVK